LGGGGGGGGGVWLLVGGLGLGGGFLGGGGGVGWGGWGVGVEDPHGLAAQILAPTATSSTQQVIRKI